MIKLLYSAFLKVQAPCVYDIHMKHSFTPEGLHMLTQEIIFNSLYPGGVTHVSKKIPKEILLPWRVTRISILGNNICSRKLLYSLHNASTHL